MSKPVGALDIRATFADLGERFQTVRRYSLLIFIVFIAALYGFVLLRISTLTSQQPSSDAVSTQAKTIQTPHIDKAVISQLQSLQDNSVNVRTLFDQARSNPFQ